MQLRDLDSQHDTSRWSSFWPHHTGLPFKLWIGVELEGKGQRPIAQIRIGDQRCPFTVEEPLDWPTGEVPTLTPADLEALTTFLRLNHKILLAHWRGLVDSAELAAWLIPVPTPPKAQP